MATKKKSRNNIVKPRITCRCGRGACVLYNPVVRKYYVWCARCQKEIGLAKTPDEAAINYINEYGGRYGQGAYGGCPDFANHLTNANAANGQSCLACAGENEIPNEKISRF